MRLYVGRSSLSYYICDRPLVLKCFGKATKFIFPKSCSVRVKLYNTYFEKTAGIKRLDHNRQHIFKVGLEKLI